jgi:hypothetical protein
MIAMAPKQRSAAATALKRLREKTGLSVREVAKALGRPASSYATYEDAYKKPFLPPELVKGLIPVFEPHGVNRRELIALMGIETDLSMLTGGPDGRRDLPAKNKHPAPAVDVASDDDVKINELELRAMAGNGGEVEVFSGDRESEAVTGRYSFPAAGFRELYGAAPDRVRIVEVIGDSMEPTLRPGQKLMLDIADRFPTPPGIFVVFDGFGMVIKRVSIVPHSDPARVKISSDNKEYDPYERLVEEAHIQGRIIGTWRRL